LILDLRELSGRYPHQLNPPVPSYGPKPASVIMPFFKNSRGLHNVILTKRNQKLKNHPGQISFPGGVWGGEGESLLDTAFREWEEELGVGVNSLDILGSFGEFNTFTGYVIVPFVAMYYGDFNFSPNPHEVEELVLLDLDDFYNKPFYELSHPRLSGKTVYYLELHKDLLWGATAHILVRFLKEFAGFERQGVPVSPNISEAPFFNPRLPYHSGRKPE